MASKRPQKRRKAAAATPKAPSKPAKEPGGNPSKEDASASPTPSDDARQPDALELLGVGLDQRDSVHVHQLNDGLRAFEAGQYQRARQLLQPLTQGPDKVPEPIQNAARQLIDAMSIDKRTLIFAAFCLIFFSVVLILVY